MKKFLAFSLSALPAFMVTSVAFAQQQQQPQQGNQTPDVSYFTDLVNDIGNLLNALIPLIVLIAFVAILWGLARYAMAAGNEEAQAEGRRIMLWGVITLFVMVALWGFVQLLGTLTGIEIGGDGKTPGGIEEFNNSNSNNTNNTNNNTSP